jgi:integrase
MSRTYGTGSVFQRKDGRWIAQVRDKASGKLVSRSAKSERDARKLLREMTSRLDSGIRAADRNVTLTTYVEDWLANRAERGRSAGTVGEYERALRNDVLPKIGGKRIGDVSTVDIENVIHAVYAERGLSRSSLSMIQKAVSAVLTDAVRSKALGVNVAREVQLPDEARRSAPARMPSPEEVRALLTASAGTPVGRAIVVLATSGARVGELLGSTWSSLDLETGLWTIERTTTKDRRNRTILGSTTKVRRSRTIRVPELALVALREQRKYVLELRLASSSWTDLDLLFPSERGTVIDPSNFRKQLGKVIAAANKARKEADPDSTDPAWAGGSFHSMRHYFAGIGLTSYEAAEVQQLLGHATLRMTTSVYGHLAPSTAITAPDAVARTLEVGT